MSSSSLAFSYRSIPLHIWLVPNISNLSTKNCQKLLQDCFKRSTRDTRALSRLKRQDIRISSNVGNIRGCYVVEAGKGSGDVKQERDHIETAINKRPAGT